MPETEKSQTFATRPRAEKDGVIGEILEEKSENHRYIGVRIVATGQHKLWPANKIKFL